MRKSTIELFAQVDDDLKVDAFAFLDALRETGITNMFMAAPYLCDFFPELTKKQAAAILVNWIESFKPDNLYNIMVRGN